MADADDQAMTPRELCAALQIALSTFYNYQAAGRYERFELVPRIGPRRYSRRLVRQYLDREAPASLLRAAGRR
jgi:predicted site-specific integrase-resolvase